MIYFRLGIVLAIIMHMKQECKRKIIIIDKDNDSLKQLKRTFQHYSCKIDYAINEINAADKIMLNDYDYYFLSTHMNVFNLISLIKDIKQKAKILF